MMLGVLAGLKFWGWARFSSNTICHPFGLHLTILFVFAPLSLSQWYIYFLFNVCLSHLDWAHETLELHQFTFPLLATPMADMVYMSAHVRHFYHRHTRVVTSMMATMVVCPIVTRLTFILSIHLALFLPFCLLMAICLAHLHTTINSKTGPD